MADTVESVAYSLGLDTSNYTTNAESAARASDALADSADRVVTKTERVTAATRDSQGAYERLMASLDPAIAAHNHLETAIARTQGMFDRGAISAQEYGAAIEAAHSKFAAASESQSLLNGALGIGREALVGLVGGLGVGAFAEFSKNALESAAAVKGLAAETGDSIEDFQAVRAAMEANGLASDQAVTAMTRLNRAIGEAEAGNPAATRAFGELGLSLGNLSGGPEAVLPMVAHGLLDITDSSKRAQIEVALFGRTGQELESALGALSDPTSTLIDKQKALGQVMGEDVVNAAAKAETALHESWTRISNDAATLLEPPLRMFADVLDHLTQPSGMSVPAAARLNVGQTRAFSGPDLQSFLNAARNPSVPGAVSITPFGGSASAANDFAAAAGIPDQIQVTANVVEQAKEVYDAEDQFRQDAAKAWDNYYQHVAEDAQKTTDEIAEKWQTLAQKQAEDIQKVVDQIDQLMSPIYDPTAAGGYRQFYQTKNPVTDEAAKVAQEQADDLAKAQQKAADEAQGYWDRMFQTAFTGGETAFTKMLEGNRVKLGSFLDDFEKMFGTMLSDLAMKAIAEPILMPILASAAGALGLGPSAGGASGVLGSLGSLGNLSSGLGIGSGGLLGMLGLGGAASGFGGVTVTPQITGSPLSMLMNGDIGGGFSLSGLFGDLSSIAGPGALGAGLGGIISSLTGGSSTGSEIGGALGGIAGNFIPIPGVGPLIGSAVGSLIGGLFGGKPAGGYAHFTATGELADITGMGKADQTTISNTQAAANAISSAAQQLAAAGVTLNNSITTLTERQGRQTTITTSTGQIIDAGAFGNTAAASQAGLNYLLQGATSTDAITQQIISAYQKAGELQGQFAQSLISDITTVHNILNSVANPQQQTQTELEIKNINTQFDAAISKLQTLGIATTTLVNAQTTAIDAVLNTYNKAIYDAVGQVSNTALTGWSQLIDQETLKMTEAAQIGADVGALQEQNFTDQLSYLEKLSAAQRNALEEQLSLAGSLQSTLAGALSNAQSSVSGQISAAQQFESAMASASQAYASAANSLENNAVSLLVGNLSPLSPQAQYAAAQQIFQSTYAQAQQGNLTAINQLSGAGNTFLQASRAYNASGAGYATDFDTVEKALQTVAGTAMHQSTSAAQQATLAQEQVNVLTDIQANLKQAVPDANLLNAQLQELHTIADASNALVRANPVGFAELASTITGSGAATTAQLGQINLQTLAAESILGALDTTLAGGLTIANAPVVLNELQQLQAALLGTGLSAGSPIYSAIATLTAAATTGLQNTATALNVTSALDALNIAMTGTINNTSQENSAAVTTALSVLMLHLQRRICRSRRRPHRGLGLGHRRFQEKSCGAVGAHVVGATDRPRQKRPRHREQARRRHRICRRRHQSACRGNLPPGQGRVRPCGQRRLRPARMGVLRRQGPAVRHRLQKTGVGRDQRLRGAVQSQRAHRRH